MKKTVSIFALILALALTLSAFCGCDGGNSGKKTYTFDADGIMLKIGAPASVVNSLGTPIAKDESASCGGIPGVDEVYVFSGFKVYTTPAKDGNVINKIEITDDSVKTPEGVAAGSTRAEVIKAMGEPTSESGASLVYAGNGMKLTFIIRNDTVTSIQYVTE
ncbi:MAG: hypothetical protein E7589_04245 [Ruminococcaceae bacterium]|nr:hypothetical protein [Oscillospiraceae bacterium]